MTGIDSRAAVHDPAHRILTTADVAAICRTSAETVRYWRYIGAGPVAFKAGRKVLYATEDVEAWLAEKRRQAADGAA